MVARVMETSAQAELSALDSDDGDVSDLESSESETEPDPGTRPHQRLPGAKRPYSAPRRKTKRPRMQVHNISHPGYSSKDRFTLAYTDNDKQLSKRARALKKDARRKAYRIHKEQMEDTPEEISKRSQPEKKDEEPFMVHGWEVPVMDRTMFTPQIENDKYLKFTVVLNYLSSTRFVKIVKEKIPSRKNPLKPTRNWYKRSQRMTPIFAYVAKLVLPEKLRYFSFLNYLIFMYQKSYLDSQGVYHILANLVRIINCKGRLRYPLEEELCFIVLKIMSKHQPFGWFREQLSLVFGLTQEEMAKVDKRVQDIIRNTCKCEMHGSWPLKGEIYIPVFKSLYQSIKDTTKANSSLDWDKVRTGFLDLTYARICAYSVGMYGWGYHLPLLHSLHREESIPQLNRSSSDPVDAAFDPQMKSFLMTLLRSQGVPTLHLRSNISYLSTMKLLTCPCDIHVQRRKEVPVTSLKRLGWTVYAVRQILDHSKTQTNQKFLPIPNYLKMHTLPQKDCKPDRTIKPSWKSVSPEQERAAYLGNGIHDVPTPVVDKSDINYSITTKRGYTIYPNQVIRYSQDSDWDEELKAQTQAETQPDVKVEAEAESAMGETQSKETCLEDIMPELECYCQDCVCDDVFTDQDPGLDELD